MKDSFFLSLSNSLVIYLVLCIEVRDGSRGGDVFGKTFALTNYGQYATVEENNQKSGKQSIS